MYSTLAGQPSAVKSAPGRFHPAQNMPIRWSPPSLNSASQCAMMVTVKTTINSKKEETTMNITTVGLDLAKSVFHAVCCNQQGNEEYGSDPFIESRPAEE
jgi:hypothetical protein